MIDAIQNGVQTMSTTAQTGKNPLILLNPTWNKKKKNKIEVRIEIEVYRTIDKKTNS